MIDFSKEIKKKNDNDDEDPQPEKKHVRDMKKKREKEKEEESKKKLTDQELLNKWGNLEEDSISKSQNQELGMEK